MQNGEVQQGMFRAEVSRDSGGSEALYCEREFLLVVEVRYSERRMDFLFCSFMKAIICLFSGGCALCEAFRALHSLVSWRELSGDRGWKNVPAIKSSMLAQNVIATDDPATNTLHCVSEFRDQFFFSNLWQRNALCAKRCSVIPMRRPLGAQNRRNQ